MPIEKYYSLKSIFERIWGKNTYIELKHCSDLRVWKKYAQKTLKASKLAIQETVQIRDEHWQETANMIIEHSVDQIGHATDFDELFHSLSAGYIELSFHQIGLVPTRPLNMRRPILKQQEWRLDAYRSPQYVQSPEQEKALDKKLQKSGKIKNGNGSAL